MPIGTEIEQSLPQRLIDEIEDGPGDCHYEVWQSKDGEILVRMYSDDAHCWWAKCEVFADYGNESKSEQMLVEMLEALRDNIVKKSCDKKRKIR